MNLRALLLPLALAACQNATPAQNDAAPPLAGARIGGPFTVTDQDGRTVTDRSFAGKYRLMYFGYTFCPDVCPTDVAAIAAGMKQLDPAVAAKVVPIFVTVDPERDTPAALKQFVGDFPVPITALTGTPAQIDAIKKAYGVYAAKGKATPDGGYMVDHSRQAYLMDPANRPVALVPQDQGAAAVAATVGQWVR